MFNKPTKNVDINTKTKIYKIINNLATKKLNIVVISSYLPKILKLTNHVLIMHKNTIASELPATKTNKKNILRITNTKNKKKNQ